MKVRYLKCTASYILAFLLALVLMTLLNSDKITELYKINLGNDISKVSRFDKSINTNKIIKNNNIDSYTECALLSTGVINNHNDANDFIKTIRSPSILGCEDLNKFLMFEIYPAEKLGNTNNGFVNYDRFWHGYTILSKPLILLGGIRLLNIINVFLTFLATLIFLFFSIKKLGFKSLYIILPFLIYVNISIVFFISSSLPLVLIFIATSIMLKYNFCITKCGRIHLFFYGFFWYFFCFLVNPVLISTIPACAYLIFVDSTKITTAYRIKTFLYILLLPVIGLLSSITAKILILKCFSIKSDGGLKSSYYWIYDVSFNQAIDNLLVFTNFEMFLLSLIILILFSPSLKMDDVSVYLFLIIVGATLAYPYFLPQHTIHSFSAGSSFGILSVSLIFLRAASGTFLREPIMGRFLKLH